VQAYGGQGDGDIGACPELPVDVAGPDQRVPTQDTVLDVDARSIERAAIDDVARIASLAFGGPAGGAKTVGAARRRRPRC
jgi:hypothetical protein